MIRLVNPSRKRPPLALLAWRQTWRDFRAGELRLLGLAVVLAVAALSAVSFFADRLQAGLARDAGQLLGGDLAVSGDQPPAARMGAVGRRPWSAHGAHGRLPQHGPRAR
jgi:putative ABC transport system permease protein